MPRKRLTEEGVRKLKFKPDPAKPKLLQTDYFDAGMPGLVLRVNYGGKKVWRALYYEKKVTPDGRTLTVSRTQALGRYPVLDLKQARDAARKFLADPKAALKQDDAKGTFKEVAERWFRRHVQNKEKPLRSAPEIRRCLERYVYPRWENRSFVELRRSNVNLLHEEIEKDHGPRQAGMVLAFIRAIMNWYAKNEDDYQTPIVRGSKEGASKARERVLSHEEIRALWKACDEFGPYGAAVKCGLLTAQRFYKVANDMRRSDIQDRIRVEGRFVGDEWQPDLWVENVWDPTRNDDPENKLVSLVPLSSMARSVIDAVPVIGGDTDYVFTLNGRAPLNGWSGFKKRLDKRMEAVLIEQANASGQDPSKVKFEPWQFRDLRRTAKTLMTRNGVSREVSEHCLAHKILGVEGVYDLNDYITDKQRAFEKLASVVERIINPREGSNVVPLHVG
jgi:integrase